MFLKLRALLLANDTKDLCCGLVLDDVADGGLNNCNARPLKIISASSPPPDIPGTEFTHFGVFLAASLSFIMNFP